MSSEESLQEEEVQTILSVVSIESSDDPPMEEWSSLIIDAPERNMKKQLFAEGLYTPGSEEICAKYIAMSRSSMLRHPYYNYPAVTDPGIIDALLKPEKLVIYADDGQDLYLAICKEMDQCPIKRFLNGLLEEQIDLSYYGVNSNGVRAMAMALKFNKHVKSLNLTDNFLTVDACYHLGDMLVTNSAMKELNLSGCRIGPEGTRRIFANLVYNKNLVTLNLNRNKLGDTGVECITKAVLNKLNIKQIYLSYNNISGKSLMGLAEAFETYNKFTVIDLSWNNLYGVGTNVFLNKLAESDCLQDLNLSWNNLYGSRISNAIKNVIKSPHLRNLNLSNNKLVGDDINNIIAVLGKAKKLVTLDLSYNPMSPADALQVLNKVKLGAVKVQQVYMENVYVTTEFLCVLENMKGMKLKKNTIVTYGGVIDFTMPKGPDARELLLNRAEFLAKKPKKYPFDIGLIILQLEKMGIQKMNAKQFVEFIEASGAPLDAQLIEEFVNVFPGPKTAKSKSIDITGLVDYIHRKWPERRLPPTPPPEPEPEVLPPAPDAKDKKKGKGKK